MVAKTPTEAMSLAAASASKTALIAAADAMVSAVDDAINANSQAWTLAIAGTPTGGTYTITLTDAVYGARTTSALAHNANSAAVQAALRLLAGEGLSLITVSEAGSAPNFTHTIQFKGTKVSITVTATSSLTGGTPSITPTQTSAHVRRLGSVPGDMFKEKFVDLMEVLATDMRA